MGIYEGHTKVMITMQLWTNAMLSQCVVHISSVICFLTTDWNSCHQLTSRVHISVWENGWGGHVLLVMCIDIISFMEEIPTLDIYAWLQHACGDACIGSSTVRWWASHLKTGTHSSLVGIVVVAHRLSLLKETKGKLILSERIDIWQLQKWQRKLK